MFQPGVPFGSPTFGPALSGLPNLTATGTDLASAYQITAADSVFTNVPPGSGCRLPAPDNQPRTIYNYSNNVMLVYPALGDLIAPELPSQPVTLSPNNSFTLSSFSSALTVQPRPWYMTGGSNNSNADGDVVGPGSSAATAVALFSGTTGKIIADGSANTGILGALQTKAVTGAAAGDFSNTGWQLPFLFSIGGANPITIQGRPPGPYYNIDAVAGAVLAPVGSTQLQADGIAGYAQSNSPGTYAVGMFSTGVCGANGVYAWGENPGVNDNGFASPFCQGSEIDCVTTNGATNLNGLSLNITATARTSGALSGIVVACAGGGALASTFTSADGSAINGLYLGALTAPVFVTAVSWSSSGGGKVTATTQYPHGITTGAPFTISGMLPSGYNGTFTALSGTTGSTVVYALASNPGTETALGTFLAASTNGQVLALNARDASNVAREATIYGVGGTTSTNLFLAGTGDGAIIEFGSPVVMVGLTSGAEITTVDGSSEFGLTLGTATIDANSNGQLISLSCRDASNTIQSADIYASPGTACANIFMTGNGPGAFVEVGSPFKVPQYTIAAGGNQLPAASENYAGCHAYVTDFNGSPTFLGAVGGGGGTTITPVFCNGAAWVTG